MRRNALALLRHSQVRHFSSNPKLQKISLEKIDRVRKYPIYKVALTGGPAGGKSSALQQVKASLEANGFKVFTVPETATIMFTNGAEWDTLPNEEARFNLLKVITNTQIALEDNFYKLAEYIDKPSVIICDRGVLDNEAYCSTSYMWELILHDSAWSIPLLRERRYDQVIHLVTTAIGAREHYTTANNAARRENADQAAALDGKILAGYIGHPRLVIIDNRTGFKEKVQRVVHHIYDLLQNGNAAGEVQLKRYIIEPTDKAKHERQRQRHTNKHRSATNSSHDDFFYYISKMPVDVQRYKDVIVEKTFLTPTSEQVSTPEDRRYYPYIARISESSMYQYFYRPVNTPTKDLIITAGEYLSLMDEVDTSKRPVTKRIRFFVYDNQYFSLCDVNNGESQYLQVAVDSKLENVRLPTFLTENDQVTLLELSSQQVNESYNDISFAMTPAYKQ